MKMKLTLITLVGLVFSCISGISYGQNSDKEITSIKSVNTDRNGHQQTFKVDSAKLATKKVSNEIIVNAKDVNYYNNFINALETKREYVLNDPEEKAMADESGWFDQIDAEIKNAKAERDELLKK